jgi:hypothetical protein
MIVVVKIATLRLDLVESSWNVAARSSGEIDLALRTRCSSTLSLARFLPCPSWFLGILQCCVLSHDTDNRSTGLLGCDSWVSGVLFLFPFPWVRTLLLHLVCCFGQAEDFPHCWYFVDSGIVLSRSFFCCLAELHFVQPLFCDDHHRTRCTLPVHEKVLQPSWVSFASDAKLLVLESNLWLVRWSLFCHQLLESRISVAWIFSRSSAMALCLSACSCTDPTI